MSVLNLGHVSVEKRAEFNHRSEALVVGVEVAGEETLPLKRPSKTDSEVHPQSTKTEDSISERVAQEKEVRVKVDRLKAMAAAKVSRQKEMREHALIRAKV
jgi:hypothetical protein